MPEKTFLEEKPFDCPKCNRNVTFKYLKIHRFADQVPEPVHKSLVRVTDFGQCQVAAQLKTPNHPIDGEMDSCPFYQALPTLIK